MVQERDAGWLGLLLLPVHSVHCTGQRLTVAGCFATASLAPERGSACLGGQQQRGSGEILGRQRKRVDPLLPLAEARQARQGSRRARSVALTRLLEKMVRAAIA